MDNFDVKSYDVKLDFDITEIAFSIFKFLYKKSRSVSRFASKNYFIILMTFLCKTMRFLAMSSSEDEGLFLPNYTHRNIRESKSGNIR